MNSSNDTYNGMIDTGMHFAGMVRMKSNRPNFVHKAFLEFDHVEIFANRYEFFEI